MSCHQSRGIWSRWAGRGRHSPQSSVSGDTLGTSLTSCCLSSVSLSASRVGRGLLWPFVGSDRGCAHPRFPRRQRGKVEVCVRPVGAGGTPAKVNSRGRLLRLAVCPPVEGGGASGTVQRGRKGTRCLFPRLTTRCCRHKARLLHSRTSPPTGAPHCTPVLATVTPQTGASGAKARLHSHPPNTHGWDLAAEPWLLPRALLTIVPQGPSAPAQSSFSCWLPSPSPGELLHARTVGPRPNTTRLSWLPQGHARLLRVSLWVR